MTRGANRHGGVHQPKGTFLRRFLVWVLPALVAADVLVSAGHGALTYLKTREQIFDKQFRSVPVVAESVAEPLWGLRYDQVLAILEGLTADSDIMTATVQDDRGYVVATAGVLPTGMRTEEVRFPVRYDRHQISRLAGSVSVRVSLRRAWSDAAGGLLAGLTTAFASSIAVLLGVISVNHSLIVRPLGALLKGIEQLRRGGTLHRIRLIGAPREFDHVIAAFNDMQDKLETDELERAEITGRLDIALSNMAYGLMLFAPDGELLLVNARCAKLLELPEAAIVAGMNFREIIDVFARCNPTGDRPTTKLSGQMMKIVTRQQVADHTFTLPSGRMISASDEHLANGGWLCTYEDITERRRSEKQIAYLARHDALSGLPNRATFNERLELALLHLARGVPFAILCLDLDRFKEVNDTFGHAIGDALLKSVSERLSTCASETDTVARLGGDEFAILQHGTNDPSEVTILARRIIEVLTAPYDLDGRQILVGASVGIALAPADGTSADVLLKNSDMALYQAKADGRGTFRFFNIGMDARQQARRQMEIDLRQAIAHKQFELYYQPLMNVQQQCVVSFEALIRWNHPERGIISPDDFIPLAEETGLIVEIGRWVLRTACEEARRWPAEVKVAVNLSPVQFKKENLLSAVIEALQLSGLDPARLELEITENILIRDTKATLEMLNMLQDMGISIALDDFGMGYSSLSYLRRFSFDKIKIDRSFVSELTTQPESAAIVRAVAALGRSLGISTTGEGVETFEQLAQLASDGCTEAQGYLFSKPRPGGEVLEMIRRLDTGFTQYAEQTAAGGFRPAGVTLGSRLFEAALMHE